VLFLDELNRARPEILQTIMDLALNRKLAGRKLPEGSRIISAVNEGDQYQLTDLDPALVSRFNILTFQPSVQEWLLWARKEKVDDRVIAFIEENPIWLDKDPDAKENEDTGLDKTPDRRAWKRVSDVIKGVSNLTAVHNKVISGIVGGKAASAFIACASVKKLVSGKEVIMNFEKVKTKIEGYAVHELSVVNDGIFRYLEVEKVDQKDKEKVAKNLEAYFDYLAKNKKEGAAHFANTYVQGIYSNAASYMAKECRVLVMFLAHPCGIQ